MSLFIHSIPKKMQLKQNFPAQYLAMRQKKDGSQSRLFSMQKGYYYLIPNFLRISFGIAFL